MKKLVCTFSFTYKTQKKDTHQAIGMSLELKHDDDVGHHVADNGHEGGSIHGEVAQCCKRFLVLKQAQNLKY